jgi:lysyl-tRNA synthetase class 1
MSTMIQDARSWPFVEARRLLSHIEAKGKKPGDMVTFETGYGPSGAPHIGTFGEVVRTLWVMRAFRAITQDAYPTRLIMFSDDYDALRKVPDDMPEWMNEHLGRPLTYVPSPYAWEEIEEASFGQANNEKLARFVQPLLTAFDGGQLGNTSQGAQYGMVSSAEYYQSGAFNEMLDKVWDNYDAIQAILLPTFKDERRNTYSPFMPLSQNGRLIQTGVIRSPSIPYWIEYRDLADDGPRGFSSTTHNGRAKLQWYVDWAMRWVYFDVDYEMSGKDLMDSVRLSSQICKVLGGTPPVNLTYELFLDDNGAKISKSKGNGFTIEEWRRYGSMESLMLFMFQSPRSAKKLHADIVPQLEDQYLKLRSKVPEPDDAHWHFTTRDQPALTWDVSYGLLLSLAQVSQSRHVDQLVGYVEAVRHIDPQDRPMLHELAGGAINYLIEAGALSDNPRRPRPEERVAILDLADQLERLGEGLDDEGYQAEVYEVGKRHGYQPLRGWFQTLYECLLGCSSGPRFGSLVALYGAGRMTEKLRWAARG